MMTTKKQLLLSLALTTVVGVSPLLQAGSKGSGNNQAISQSVEATQILNDDDTVMLMFTREEEKLARDVYLTLGERWGSPIFANIAVAEQKHMDTVANMLNLFGIDDPVENDSISVFTNPELAGNYQDLVSQGEQSLLSALYAGALIEETDILDLQGFIDMSAQPQLISLYESLMKGSRNHLRAFVGEIERLGVVYQAQELDQDELDAIVDSPVERGSQDQQSGKGRNAR